MSLQTCHYEGCYNQREPYSSSTFFKLPPDEPRRSHWILNSGNKKLKNLTKTQVRHFCEKHFRQKDIKALGYRKQLHRHAVPIPHPSVRTNVPQDLDENTTIEQTLAPDNQDFTDFQGTTVDDYQHKFQECGQNQQKDDEKDTFSSMYHQQSVFSEDSCEYNDVVAELNLTSNEDCFPFGVVGVDKEGVLNVIMKSQKELEINDNVCELDVELFSNNPDISAENVTNDIIDTALDYEGVETITNTENAVGITSPNSYSIAENIENYVEDLLPTYGNDLNSSSVENYQPDSTPLPDQQELPTTSSVASTTCSNDNNDNLATAVSMICSAANDLDNSIKADNSYESDKHYALSLVYLFQRLNAKKKTKAKIDILTYLLELENDDGDDVVLRS